MKIDEETYKEIAELIRSDENSVGIDAKTHVYIIHKLNQIEKRLEALEKGSKSRSRAASVGSSLAPLGEKASRYRASAFGWTGQSTRHSYIIRA